MLKMMPTEADRSVDTKGLVVCIPQDQVVPLGQRDVLSRGLRFDPTAEYVDQNSVLYEIWQIFPTKKLHAFFNDPNKGFINTRQDDPLSKYNQKPSNLTNSSCVGRFVDWCKEVMESLISRFIVRNPAFLIRIVQP